MAEETKPEQTVAPQAEKKEVQKTTLENIVDDLTYFAKTGFNLGLAGLIPYTQSVLVPQAARDTAILAGVQVAGDATTNYRRGRQTTSGEVLRSSVVGTTIAVPTYHAFNLVNKIPLDTIAGYAGRVAAFGGAIAPAFIGFYQTVDYLVRNLSFKGLGKYLKENYWPTLKKFWTRVLPFSLANILFVPAYLQIPVAAGLQYLFTLFGAPKKGEVPKEQQREKQSYLAATANVAYKSVSNVFKMLYDTGYALGFHKMATKPA